MTVPAWMVTRWPIWHLRINDDVREQADIVAELAVAAEMIAAHAARSARRSCTRAPITQFGPMCAVGSICAEAAMTALG